jgi:hypothetical protein
MKRSQIYEPSQTINNYDFSLFSLPPTVVPIFASPSLKIVKPLVIAIPFLKPRVDLIFLDRQVLRYLGSFK